MDLDIRDWLPTASAQSGTGCQGTGVGMSQTAAGEAQMFIWGWEWWSPDVYLGSGSRQPPGRQLALGTGPEPGLGLERREGAGCSPGMGSGPSPAGTETKSFQAVWRVELAPLCPAAAGQAEQDEMQIRVRAHLKNNVMCCCSVRGAQRAQQVRLWRGQGQ